MKKISIANILFFIIITGIILFLNLYPTYKFSTRGLSGRTFSGIHNNVQDYYFYLSLMNEGRNGAVFISDPYTTEPHKPSIIFSYFAWLGKLSKLLNISNALMYHGVRIIFGFLFLLSAFYLISMLKLPFPKLAFLFFVFASPFLHQSIDGKGVVPYMYWWTGMDAIRRVAYLPHHMMGEFFLVTSIIFLLKYIQSQKGLFLKILFILLLPLSFILPSSLFITLLFLPPVLGFLIVKNKFRLDNWLFGLLGYWIIGLFLLFAMVSQTSQGFPWSQYIEWERRLQFPLDRELLGALGIITPLTVLGAFKAISSKRIDFILVSSWFLMPLALIPFAQKLNLSNSRLIQGVPYLPLAILATLGAKALVDFVSSSKMYAVFKRTFILKSGGTSSGSPKRAVAKTWSEYVLGLASDRTRKFLSLNNIMVSLIVLTFAISTVPTLSWSFKDQIREYWPIFGNVYLDDRIFDAFRFIDTHYPNKPIVLATFYAGNYLPAYTNTQAFVGHFGYTYNVDVKDPLTFRFFKSDMQEGEAKDFLLSNKIVLVFQGPEEKGLFNSYLYPTLLKPVYDQGETTIYEVTVSK